MKVLYVSGPIRGRDDWTREQNVRRAEEIALEVWALGVVAIVPHVLTRFYGDSLPEQIWLRGDLELITRCDGVLLLEGWEHSTGARIEERFAREKGIEIFISVGEVEQAWCQEERGPRSVGLPGVV
jgi:hypothetical protein